MTDILFISETELMPELDLARQELITQQMRVTNAVSFAKAIPSLKSNFFDVILINSYNKKLDSYELCREIKNIFRNTVKIFVFLPETNPNEASRFGLLNAEVEDKNSIQNLVNKLLTKNSKPKLEIEENITSLYSPFGGIGLSSIAILMAYTLSRSEKTSILLEASSNQSIKYNFNLDDSLALLAHDQSKNNTNPDKDWLSGFIAKTNFIPNLFYLNLFNSVQEKEKYFSKIVEHLKELYSETNKNLSAGDINQKEKNLKLSFIYNSLKLINKELDGSSYSLFNEIIQTGSNLSHTFIFDLGNDIFSPLNKQLLKYSKNVILLLKDSGRLTLDYVEQKILIESRGLSNIIPVIATNEYNFKRLSKFSDEEWLELIGETPLLYPYSLEEISALMYEQKHLSDNAKLLNFAKTLLVKTENSADIFSNQRNKGILRFLMDNYDD